MVTVGPPVEANCLSSVSAAQPLGSAKFSLRLQSSTDTRELRTESRERVNGIYRVR